MQKTSWTEQKEQSKKQRRRFVVASFGLLALALLFAYMFVWQRVYTLQLAEEHSHRKLNVSILKERIQSLQSEVEYLSSLENIETIARQQLDMVPLREAEFAKTIAQPLAKSPATPLKTTTRVKVETKDKAVAKSSSTPAKSSAPAKKPKPLPKKSAAKGKGVGKAGA